ncbi:MAG: carboxymuconolactone decarboxylase [Azospira oryzae]|jgi:uncharacterized peroxidase-related enzyme|nr:carboxymuconolactone decarboxylase [Cytophaga sp.]PZR38795.1 MAG: carboxymuconolactone decarboxylase [Azospira oryzae]
MAHIAVNEQLPGIVGLLHFRPETAKPLNELAEILLRDENSLTRGEREIIASYVSYRNNCHFCHTTHGAVAAHHYGGNLSLIDDIKAGCVLTPLSPKMRTLLKIADKVQQNGKAVLPSDVELARSEGATDREIHDTVLIAAAFCMFNRYVDGLGTFAPPANEAYNDMGKLLAFEGYNVTTPEIV